MTLRRPNGLTWEFWPEGKIVEGETLACGHCAAMKHVRRNADKDLGGYCRICNRLICGPCADKGKCVPWEEMLAKKEAEYESRKSMGLE